MDEWQKEMMDFICDPNVKIVMIEGVRHKKVWTLEEIKVLEKAFKPQKADKIWIDEDVEGLDEV
jgi:hypothetical protein